jgi:hypothetical protein
VLIGKINRPDPGSSANIEDTMDLLLLNNWGGKQFAIKGQTE